jgi:hypothetical protein
MGKHALLSASGSERWLTCTPSARLEEPMGDRGSDYAREGTMAHAWSELKARHQLLKTITKKQYEAEAKKLMSMAEPGWDLKEMDQATDSYIDYLQETYAAAKTRSSDAVLVLESELDYSEYVPEGFGTADAVVISDGEMNVIDLKYGKGVAVSALENPQGRLYGLGALIKYSFLYPIEKVSVTIVQPRLDSISIEYLPADELIAWAEDFVKPRAVKAFAGEGEFVTGEHCRFCKVSAVCRARAEEALSLLAHDFEQPPVLSDEEIPAILEILDKAEAWIKDIRAYAYGKALEGHEWEGFKLVEGRSNRVYMDDEMVADALYKNGWEEDAIYEKKLKGLTAMEKLLGKKLFTDLLGSLVVKPKGKPTLVPVSDRRDAIGNADLEMLLEGDD